MNINWAKDEMVLNANSLCWENFFPRQTFFSHREESCFHSHDNLETWWYVDHIKKVKFQPISVHAALLLTLLKGISHQSFDAKNWKLPFLCIFFSHSKLSQMSFWHFFLWFEVNAMQSTPILFMGLGKEWGNVTQRLCHF